MPLSDHYGTTETGIVTLNGGGRRLGVGPPVPGVEVRIDHADEKGRGEVWIRSDHGLGEYVGGPSTAASALDGGWYRSGDLGHLSTDGSLVLTGRRNVRINVAGRKVDPFEVEELILSLPEITECAVIAAPSPVTGEEVVAFVVAEDGFSWPRVRTYLAQHLSAHKIPTRVTRCSGLARTASGKVRRADLLAQLSSDAPTTSEEGK